MFNKSKFIYRKSTEYKQQKSVSLLPDRFQPPLLHAQRHLAASEKEDDNWINNAARKLTSKQKASERHVCRL